MYELWALFSWFSTNVSFPKTPEEAADALFDALDPAAVSALARVRFEDLADHYQALGDYCRNVLGLDGRNVALVKACGFSCPDDAVHLIIRMVWAKARMAQRLK